MKKLVPESIEEALKFKTGKPLNEGKLSDWFNKTKGLVQGVFKKIGNLFVALFKDKVIPAVVPVNIGILYKEGKLPSSVQYVADKSDVELEPSLSAYQNGNAILERVQKEYKEQASRNKSMNKLALRESIQTKTNIDQINETKIDLKYSGEDKVRNVHANLLIKRILMQYRDPLLMPPLIWGAPGIGKTAITKAVVMSLGPGHRIIDVQTSKMMPDDWTLPKIGSKMFINSAGKEISLEEARDVPKNWLPVYLPSGDQEEDERRNDAANWGEGGIIFLDELSRAKEEVQNTCLKLVDERIIGDHKLGSKWAIVAATNRPLDDPTGGQIEIGSALANRFQHYNFVPTVDEWIEWAKGKKIDSRITDFVDFNRDHFYFFDNETKVNTTPRTWEALSKMLAACQDYEDIVFSRADLEDIIGGTINAATVEQFMAFMSLLETWRPEQIKMLFTDPKKAPKPKKKGEGFDVAQANALIGAACSTSKDMKLTAQQLENYVQYWIDLGNASLAAKALWLIVETHPYIHQEVGDIKGKEKYKKAMDMFRAAFGGIKFGSREQVMGG